MSIWSVAYLFLQKNCIVIENFNFKGTPLNHTAFVMWLEKALK